MAALGILTILLPHIIFPVCQYFGIYQTVLLTPATEGFVFAGATAPAPLPCYWMAWAEVAVGIPLLAAAVILFFSRRAETQRSMAILGIVLGLMVILLPTAIIGTCPDSSHPCNTGAKPALVLLGAATMAVSGLAFFTKEKAILPTRKAISTTSIIERSIKGRRFRTALTVACIAVVTGTLFTTSILMTGVNQSIEAQTGKLGADIIVTREGYTTPIEKILLTGQLDVNEVDRYLIDHSLEKNITAITGVEKITPQLYLVTLTEASCCAVWSVLLVGFDPETDFIVKPWLKTEMKTPMERDDLLQGTYMLLPVGGETIFYGHLFRIKGELEPTGTGTDMAVYMPLKGAYAMAEDSYVTAEKPCPVEEGQVSAFFIKVAPEYSIEDVALMINIKVKGVDTITATTAGQTVRGQVSSLLQTFLLTDGIMWGMSALLIAAIFFMVVNERRREIGLLRAMGATKRYVFKLIMLEAVILALIGGIVGIVAGGAIIYFLEGLIVSALNIPYISPTMISIGVLMGVAVGLAAAIGVLAAFYPAARISRIDPYDAVRSGEL